MTRRIFNAALGFALGIVTAPFALVAWPIALAWFVFNESDGDDV